MNIAPSILAADLGHLRQALEVCGDGGADLAHLDVMDGHFVPNLTFGPPMVAALDEGSPVEFDLHLMVANPGELLDDYLAGRPRWLSVHWEATVHLDRLVGRIQEAGVGAGVALNPATPLEVLRDFLPRLDFVLLMSVNPGFAGQPFLPYVLDKARRLRRWIEDAGVDVAIEMDGGIAQDNLEEVRDAGVDVAVVGSGVYKRDDPVAALRDLLERGGRGR